MSDLLAPELLGRLRRLRWATRRRVVGRYTGQHGSRRHGASLDFADHREYTPGDDLRHVDLAAYQRLGRVLVKLYEAEDEAAVRIVLDRSPSMGFGAKFTAARQAVALLVAVAANSRDRVRVVLAGDDAAPDRGGWYAGPAALAAVTARLRTAAPGPPAPGVEAALVAALRSAAASASRGPLVLVSDLLFDGWPEVVRALAASRGDAVVVHVLGRDDLEPEVRGDVRLVDAETGAEVEVGITEQVLRAHAAARDAWLADVAATCGRHGVDVVRLVDHEPVDRLVDRLLAVGLLR